MTAVRTEIRQGTYADSVVLMQLQSELSRLEGVLDAGVVMGTPANLELLKASDLLTKSAESSGTDDLIIVVLAETKDLASQALSNIDSFLVRGTATETEDYRPKRLRTAKEMLPESNWALISTPGKWAGDVAREALDLGLNVFLYSDNVDLEDEVSLKTRALSAGQLVLGPDCGTTLIDGVGFGFANRVRRGPIGVVAASGTGIQAITSRVHELGSGISHAIGTGGRDLYARVAARTARQSLDLLARDSNTKVIVLASKPPEPAVASRLLSSALRIDKPVVVQFSDFSPPASRVCNLLFARSLSEAADLAVDVADSQVSSPENPRQPYRGGFLRGLFAGGTLALEAVQGLGAFLTPLYSNLVSDHAEPLTDQVAMEGHTILDLGADDYTVGRLHPMMDQQLRIQLLEKASRETDVGVILMDVVLGAGSHPDPAAELAPVVRKAQNSSNADFVVILIGTDEDPQGLAETSARLEEAGARVFSTVTDAVEIVVSTLSTPEEQEMYPVGLEILGAPIAVNIGLESFYDDLVEQGVSAMQLDWRPPARGSEQVISILERMRS
jgi:FdrA protein